MLRVAVFGGYGAMGSAASAAIDAADDMRLVARIGREDDVVHLDDVDVAVDLTHPDSVMANISGCLARGIRMVVGTSGFDAPRLELVAALVAQHGGGVVIAPNFSIGAVLMMRFAAEAAPYFQSAEVVELHRDTKPDAPSGTARRTAELIAQARRGAATGPIPDSTTHALEGARGAVIDGVHVHSVRLRGLLAHQEVLLGTDGEVLTLRHDSLDRSSFMPGILLAIREVRQRRGLTVGLDKLLWLR